MAKTAKKILIITEIYPTGLTGTSVKTRNTVQFLLKQGFSLDLCCLQHADLADKKITHQNLQTFQFTWPSYSKKDWRFWWRLLQMLFSFVPLQLKETYSPQLAQKIAALVKKNNYDFIFFDGFFSLQYLEKRTAGQIYIDDEDITDLYWQRMRGAANIFKKLFYYTEFLKSLVYERYYLPKVSRVWAISKNTLRRLKKLTPAKTSLMPTLISPQKSAYHPRSKDIVFTGLLNWEENEKGIEWFLENCWSTILKKRPATKLFIIGQMAGDRLLKLFQQHQNVIYKGYVPKLATVYKKSAIAIAPIFINSGIKIKVLTYLAYGLPVVSTKKATWGMNSLLGIKTAQSPRSFTRAILDLLENNKQRNALAKEAQQNIVSHHSAAVLKQFFHQQRIV